MERAPKRISIELSDRARHELDELKKKLDASSMTDVIRASLAITKFLEMQKEQGNEIIIRDPKSKSETKLMSLR